MIRTSLRHPGRSFFNLFDRLFTLECRVGDTKSVKPIRLTMTALEDRLVPDGRPLPYPTLFVGSGHSDAPQVRVLDAESGELKFSVQPFGASFKGGNSVASADFNNDTVPDLLVGAGKGGGPRVRVLNGISGSPIASPISDFWAYDLNFTGGVEVAAGDVDGDGRMDAVTVASTGGGPRVRAFSGATGEVLADFFAYESNFKGGLHVAMGDFNIDGKDEIVVAAGAGGGPRVSIFTPSGKMLEHRLKDFFAFDPENRSGVYLAVGDVNGDTLPDIITGSGAGVTSTVRVYNGRDGSRMVDRVVRDDNGVADTNGVRVATAWINDDRYADIVTASGPGGTKVKVYAAGTASLAGMPLDHFAPFESAEGGIMIAAANDPGVMDPDLSEATIDPGLTLMRGQQFEITITVTDPLPADGREVDDLPTGTMSFYARERGAKDAEIIPLGQADLVSINTYSANAVLRVTDVALPALEAGYDVWGEYTGDTTFKADVSPAMTTELVIEAPSTLPVSTPFENTQCEETNPVELAFGSGTNSGAAIGAGNIRLFDGSASISRVDLSSSGFGTTWDQSWIWTNAQGVADGAAGVGSRSSDAPLLLQVNGTDSVALVHNTQVQFFDRINKTYVPRFAQDHRLTTSSGRFNFSDGRGNKFVFYDFSYGTAAMQGRMETYTSAAGVTVTAGYTSGVLTELSRVEGSGGSMITESFLYEHVSGGVNDGLVETVTLRRKTGTGSFTSGDTVRSVDYSYYTTGGDVPGIDGNLRLAVVKDAAGNPIDTTYYRYYSEAAGKGYTAGSGADGLVKFVFGPNAYARLVQALGSGVDDFSDAAVLPYCDNYLEYDESDRVITHTVAGDGCSACSGGQGTYTYTYSAPNEVHGGANIWLYQTVETLPDGATNTVFMNASGQVLLTTTSPDNSSVYHHHFQKFNGRGQVVMTADPASIGPSNDPSYYAAYADLMNDAGGSYSEIGSGLIRSYSYATSTTATSGSAGNVAGYLANEGLGSSQPGTASKQAVYQYILRSDGTQNLAFPASVTRYRNATTGAQATSMVYAWQGSTAQPASITTTLPTVTTTQNGPNSATSTVTVFDSYGRPAWIKDEAGFLSYTAYDTKTGAVTRRIMDVEDGNTGDFANLPSGWTTPASGGLHLITDSEVDSLGRSTKLTSPNGRVDYTVYKDATQEVRYYPAWDTALTPDGPTGPTLVSRHDRARGYTETISITAAPSLTSLRPNGTESFTASDIASLARSVQNEAGQTVASDTYFNLTSISYSTSSVTLGTKDTNYHRSEYAYGMHNGLRNKVVSPAGTITRTEFDLEGRPVSEWVGTDDVPTTGNWSPTNLTGTNMTQVRSYGYDVGPSWGDGRLTTVTESPGGGAATRTTRYGYDHRGRLIYVKEGSDSNAFFPSESSGLHRPMFTYEYDNLDQVTQENRSDGDGYGYGDSSIVRARTDISYDELGRVFKSEVRSVNQTNGTVSSTALTTSIWYDLRGNAIKTKSPGNLVQKMQYDGAGRLLTSFASDGGGDSGYGDADDVTGDIVLEQQEMEYDANGNLRKSIARQRFHDETDTGALEEESGSSTVKARVSFQGYYYDAADRLVTTIDVGTNAGSDWTRPSTLADSANNRSDTVLRTDVSYDAAGRQYEVTDPMNRKSRTLYDLMGRTKETYENHVDGTVGADNDKKTVYTYGPAGMTSLTAYTTSSDFQTTEWVYGFTSGLYTNDLVKETRWPTPTSPGAGTPSSTLKDVVTINALGETVTSTDRNGSLHTYSYDLMGRITDDTVTTPGSGVDGAVRRIKTEYDTQGNAYKFTSYSDTAGTTVVNQVQRAFNNLGQLITEYQAHGGAVNTGSSPKVQYAYTEMASSANHSRPTTVTYPDGRVLTHNYASGINNDVSRLSSLSDSGGTLETYDYLGLGTVVKRGHPLPTSPASSLDLTYITSSAGDAGDQYGGLDRFGRIVDQNWKVGSTVKDEFLYTYDRNSNRLTKTNPVSLATSPNLDLDEVYTYDGLNQIATYDRDDGYDQDWTYDGLGNWDYFDDNGTTQDRSHDAQNQITGGVGAITPTYDLNGNMTKDETDKRYVYDAWNRLVTVKNSSNATIATYAYDALTRRVTEYDGTTTSHLYYSKDWQVLEERLNSNSYAEQQYVWSPVYVDAMILRDKDLDHDTVSHSLEERLWATHDANFNVTGLVDTTGAVVERFTYTPFGVASVKDANFTPDSNGLSDVNWIYRHQGGRWSPISGLMNFRMRDYSPTLGRWMRNDPIGFISRSTNFILSFANNPLNKGDAYGLADHPLTVVPESDAAFFPRGNDRLGGFTWNINWSLGGKQIGLNGYIVQHITSKIRVFGCDVVERCEGYEIPTKYLGNQDVDFYEVWEVEDGIPKGGDKYEFRFLSMSDDYSDSRGFASIRGRAKFIPKSDWNGPNPFRGWTREGVDSTVNGEPIKIAKGQWTSKSPPPGWSDAGATVHDLLFEWDWCGEPPIGFNNQGIRITTNYTK